MGKVFDIQRMSVHDGPGIRTTVFLKGCPLRCLWCHNPESQSFDRSIGFSADKCTACGNCAEVCKAHSVKDGSHRYDRSICVACGKCTDVCLNQAILRSGKDVTADEVIREVMKDKTFYKNSGGGVTFSGGEPLSQPQFLLELLMAAKQAGLHTAVDTSGFGKSETVREIAPYTDLFLFDWKESDEQKHIEFTGVSHRQILENLRILDGLKAKVFLRCPIVPNLNDRTEHLDGIADLAAAFSCIEEVYVMAYHTLGNGKYTAFEIENPMQDMGTDGLSKERTAALVDDLQKRIADRTDRPIAVKS